MLKILTVIGARPQFAKAGVVSRVLSSHHSINELIVHTGQHFDNNMPHVFFDQLHIPKPKYNLGISSLSHGAMTGRMVEKIEELVISIRPDWMLLYGDTNSTLAGAVAASKLNVPIAHAEAGLRANDLSIPEEVNRVLTDRLSTLLLCPTQHAVKNLQHEGYPFMINSGRQQKIENIGDVMLDAVLHYRQRAMNEICLADFGVNDGEYVLCTIHRQENADNRDRLVEIFRSLRDVAREMPVIFPIHPRTKVLLNELCKDSSMPEGVIVIDPVSYLEMQRLEMSARVIITDSGGVQKEAFFHGVPCITLRDKTEWMETLENGQTFLVGSNHELILKKFNAILQSKFAVTEYKPFGDGQAAKKLLQLLLDFK